MQVGPLGLQMHPSTWKHCWHYFRKMFALSPIPSFICCTGRNIAALVVSICSSASLSLSESMGNGEDRSKYSYRNQNKQIK